MKIRLSDEDPTVRDQKACAQGACACTAISLAISPAAIWASAALFVSAWGEKHLLLPAKHALEALDILV